MTSIQQSRFWEDDDDCNDESTYSYDQNHHSIIDEIFSSDSSSSEEEFIAISKRRINNRFSRKNFRINRFNRCFATGKKIPLETLYNCQHIWDSFRDQIHKNPTIKQFQLLTQISSDRVIKKIIKFIKSSTSFKHFYRKKTSKGLLSRLVPNDIIREQVKVYMYELYQENPQRSLNGYKKKIQQKFNIKISCQTISRWFNTKQDKSYNAKHRAITCVYSQLKVEPENMLYYRNFCNLFSSIFHDSVVFIDEKSFILNDLFKKRVRRDPFTGEIPIIIVSKNLKIRKRYNMICSIRASTFNQNHIEYMIFDSNVTSFHFFQFIVDLIKSKHIVRGDIVVYDNCKVHTSKKNDFLMNNLSACGVAIKLLPKYSPELNPIEKIFNIITLKIQKILIETTIDNENEFIFFLKKSIESITVETIKKVYIKCGYVNF